jgi:acetyl-CoA synthetase
VIVPRDPPRSAAARRQDADWTQYIEHLSRDPKPFATQHARFATIFAGRRPQDGPPLVWQPTPSVVDASNLAQLMRATGFGEYADLHRWSIEDRTGFWTAVLRELPVRFTTPPSAILDGSGGPTATAWLPGAKLSCVDACFAADGRRTAIVFGSEDREELRSVTYAELSGLVDRFARGLRRRGLAGRGVALYMPMTVECVAAYLGVISAGGYVVSIADSFQAGELRTRLALGGAEAAVTVSSYQRGGRIVTPHARLVAADGPPAIVVTGVDGPPPTMRPHDCTWGDILDASEEPGAHVIGSGSDTINVLFSSGTTGTPKAIPWTHLTPLKSAMDGRFHQDIHPTDVVAWPTNVGWMMGPWLIFATFLNSATMALFEGSPTTAEFVRFVTRAGVSVLGVIPALVRAWRRDGLVDRQAWSGVRLFSSTGEASAQEDYLWLMSRTGYRAPVIEYLGGTEIGGGHITGTVMQPASPATFTTPALGIDVALRTDAGSWAAPGEEGELFLVPPALGLSDRLLAQDHDAVYYRDCPVGPGGVPLRRHGDQMALLHQGFTAARGRADDTMNLGGIKVSSREIERVVDEHPAVYESAAVAVQIGGGGADHLVLFTVLREPLDLAPLHAELARAIATSLNPLYRVHDVVAVDALPRTASNKVLRRELRRRYDER